MPKRIAPKTFSQHLGAVISGYMVPAGVLQPQLAKEMGLSVATVGRKLRGETDISVSELLAIAKIVRRPASTLLREALDNAGLADPMSAASATNVTTGNFNPNRNYEGEHAAGTLPAAAQDSTEESRSDETYD
jgi:transcriptional regulator with XRE-family HTH domain